MKRFNTLKVWTIIWSIITLISIIFTVLYVCRIQAIGEFYLWIYEDITCEYGHTVTGLFNKLIKISAIKSAAFCVIEMILVFFVIKNAADTKSIEGQTSTTASAELKAVERKEKAIKKEKAKRVVAEVVDTAVALIPPEKKASVSEYLKNIKINKKL